MQGRRFDDRFADEVRQRADILEIIGEHVSLRRTGKNHVGLCPFHTEDTPSFSVSAERGMYYCFGCGAGGNVFTFLMRKEGLSFVEALRRLADRYGLAMPSEELTPAQKRRLAALDALEAAAKFYAACLASPQGANVRAYLEGRGVSAEVAGKFRLGYAPPGWDNLLTHLKGKGFRAELAVYAGLASQGEQSPYDRFRDRLMFSICDAGGRVTGFGARVLAGADGPKYLNSPESDVFSKGRGLYALHLARGAAREQDRLIVVEGYMDVIAMHRAGFTGTVAPLGTALTQHQAALIGRHTKEVIIAFDADAAGQAATLRGLETLSAEGLKVRVAQLPAGKDPDEALKTAGRDALAKAIDQALPLPEYRFKLAVAAHDTSTVDGKVRAAQDIAPVLAALDNALELNAYVDSFARRLGVEPASLYGEVKRLGRARDRQHLDSPRETRNNTVDRKAPPGRKPVKGLRQRAEEELLRLMLAHPSARRMVEGTLAPKDFSIPAHAEVAAALLETAVAEPADLLNRISEDSAAMAASVFMAPAVVSDDDVGRVVADCIEAIRKDALRTRARQLEETIRSQEASGRLDPALLQELNQLVRQSKVGAGEKGDTVSDGRDRR